MQNSKFAVNDAYYGWVRTDLLALVKGNPKRALEVGCGRGQSLVELKRAHNPEYLVGMELVPAVAECARSQPEIDEVIVADLEDPELKFPAGGFDLIIAGDVLEHLKDPWKVLKRLTSLLNPGGEFVGSLPNIRCVRIVIPLLLWGKWQYQDEGILDWTHTKFFAKSTIEQLLGSAGLKIEQIEPAFGPKFAVLNKLSFGCFSNLFAYKYNFRCSSRDR